MSPTNRHPSLALVLQDCWSPPPRRSALISETGQQPQHGSYETGAAARSGSSSNPPGPNGNPAVYYSLQDTWTPTSALEKGTRDQLAAMLRMSLFFEASLDVVASCTYLCVYGYIMTSIAAPADLRRGRLNEYVDGWRRIPLFIPFPTVHRQADLECRLSLLVSALVDLSGLSQSEITSKLVCI